MRIILISLSSVAAYVETDATIVAEVLSEGLGCSNHDLTDSLTPDMVVKECEVSDSGSSDTLNCSVTTNGSDQGYRELAIGATADEVAAVLGVAAGTVRIRDAGASVDVIPATGHVSVISAPQKFQGA